MTIRVLILERQRQRSLWVMQGAVCLDMEGKFYKLAMRQSWPKVKKYKTLR